jgi:hypothetical protein
MQERIGAISPPFHFRPCRELKRHLEKEQLIQTRSIVIIIINFGSGDDIRN